MKSQKALDSLNMFVGDVIGGIGPYLAAYLRCQRHWDQTAIGAALSAMGVAAIVAQAPAGALIDNTRHKRLILFVAIAVMAVAAVSVVYMQSFAAVMVAQVMYGVGAAVAAPAIVAISLGMVGHACFADRIARNEAFNHFGNVLAALIAGVLGARISPDYVFYTVGAFAVGSLISVLFIANRDIDHDVARGAITSDSLSEHAALPIRTLVLFALSVVLFHFAFAPGWPVSIRGRPQGGTILHLCVHHHGAIGDDTGGGAGRSPVASFRQQVHLAGRFCGAGGEGVLVYDGQCACDHRLGAGVGWDRGGHHRGLVIGGGGGSDKG